MSSAFKDVAVLRRGDASGNRMVVRLTTREELEIYAIGVPQDGDSQTGPTWAYLFENEGLTLIDAGATGSFPALAEGVEQGGFRVSDIERVIITHGHSDHDGGAMKVIDVAGAECWAHEIYAHLLPYDPWSLQSTSVSPIQREMLKVAEAEHVRRGSGGSEGSGDYRARHRRYIDERQGLEVRHRIGADESFGRLTFLHAPGHSPDEICISLDGLVFTGDHVLPEITPHPTTKTRFSPEIERALPAEYHETDRLYGLETYLRSLRQTEELGPEIAALPAHRLYNKDRFNLQKVGGAGEVIQHHAGRLGRILQRIGSQPVSLEEVTRGIFSRRKLIGGNLYMALSEVVAHIELLQDAGDVEVMEDGKLRGTDSEGYRQLIHELTGPATAGGAPDR